MTVQAGPTEKRYTGNGVTTEFAIPFLLILPTDLDVFIGGVEQVSSYVITGAGQPNSTISFTPAPASGADIYLALNIPFERLFDYQENGDFLARTVNLDFDRIWQALKQLFHYAGRALSLGDTDVDGAGMYRAKGNGITGLKDPVHSQDAATKHSVEAYVASILETGQGPINNAANIIYLGPDGMAHSVQDLSGPEGAKLIGGALHKGESLDPTPVGTSLTRGAVFSYYPQAPLAGAIRIGASDLTSLNDERNFWRGLPSQNAWGDPANIGFASAAFNRNGASIGSYSTTFGHDCVTYGTASIAGGAGCATGNPDLPIETGNFTGYCAIAFGKNSIAVGEKSACFGEEHLINTRAGIGLGYAVVSQPSVTDHTPAGAAGIGRSINLFGQAFAFGANLSASDGVVIGFGPNPGTVLHSNEERAVTIGAGTELGAVRIVEPLPGETRSQVAINCQRPLDPDVETRIDLGDGKTLGIVTDGFGSSKVSLRGLKGDGTTQPIVDFEWSNPNSGSSAGSLSVKMNGRSTVAFGLLADGTPIFQELKDASGISGAPSGAVYKDGGFLKLVP